ncbi:baseplate protein [Parapedobacter defluvii]|uniref:Baseplate protein n=1 Tax=Parapedobacter defluvii TaxID=2045106 RepID=A0ABQ1MU28_9SPHI|nr:GPW/gp25 family protein [Parapedobacter defluvii]GGC44633.1 baseplate protein [Parapedobacter defluvii]
MDKLHKSFLGTGWSFPPQFDNEGGSVEMLSDGEDIRSSLEILLSTRPGERVMLPNYGCNLDELLFEPLTTTMKTYMKDLIQTAILYHEPRIAVDKIELMDTGEMEGRILINIEYTIRSTNSRFNYVFPFYIQEGTEVKR